MEKKCHRCFRDISFFYDLGVIGGFAPYITGGFTPNVWFSLFSQRLVCMVESVFSTRVRVASHRATMIVHKYSLDEYKKYFQRSITSCAYDGIPLALASKRGILIENFIREKFKGTCVNNGQYVNGRKRSRNTSTYDFEMDGKRVEVKSAQLIFNSFQNSWYIQFKHIKNYHEVLLLVAYTPFGLFLYIHDGCIGISTHGMSTVTRGKHIQICGPKHVTDIHSSWKAIHGRWSTCSFNILILALTKREARRKGHMMTYHCAYVRTAVIRLRSLRGFFWKSRMPRSEIQVRMDSK